MAAAIERGARLRVGAALRLFPSPSPYWDVSRDGSRFLLSVPKDADLQTISLIQNWSPPAR